VEERISFEAVGTRVIVMVLKNVKFDTHNSGYSEDGMNGVEKLLPLEKEIALADIEMLFRCFIGFIKFVKWDKENVYSAERHAFVSFVF
jgi:hypothetical protein